MTQKSQSSPGLSMAAGVALVVKVLAAGTTYVFTVVLARVLDLEDFGFIGFVLTASLLLSIVGVLGQRTALLRFIPPLRKETDCGGRTVQTAFLGNAYRRALLGLVGVYVLLALGITWGAEYVSVPVDWRVYLALSLIPLVGMIDMQAHQARAFGSILIALLPKDVLWRGIVMLGVLAVFWYSGGEPVPLGVVVVLLVSVLVVLNFGLAGVLRFWLRLPPVALFERRPAPETWSNATIPFWVSSVSAVLFTNIDVVIVGLMLGGEAAGLYFAANRLSMLLGFFQMSFNIVTGPMLSEHFAKNDHGVVHKIVATSVRNAFLPTLGVGLVLAVAAPYILALFGPEFSAASPVLWLLIVAAVSNAGFGAPDLLLNMCGEDKAAMRASLISMPLGILALVLGALFGGVIGVATGVVVAIILRKALFWFAARRLLNIRTDIISAFGPAARTL